MAYDTRTATGIPTEPVGSLPRPSTLQAAYAAYDDGKITQEELETEQDAAVKDSIENGEGHRRSDRLGRRAALVELRHLPDHRHAGGHRACRQPRGRRQPVLRDLRGRPPPPAAAPHGRAVQVQDLRRGHAEEVDQVRDQAHEAGGDRALDAGPALSAQGRGAGLLARAVRGRPHQRDRKGHPAGLRRGRRACLDRLHRGTAGHAQRSAQPVDRLRHAAALHRPQQPGDRSLLGRGAREHRHPHVSRR